MPTLIARKPLTYATRRLRAGDEFEAEPMHARLLIAVKTAIAKPANVPAARPPQKPKAAQAKPVETPLPLEAAAGAKENPPPLESERDADIDALRADYEAKSGERPDMRWGLARLKEEIEGLQPAGNGDED